MFDYVRILHVQYVPIKPRKKSKTIIPVFLAEIKLYFLFPSTDKTTIPVFLAQIKLQFLFPSTDKTVIPVFIAQIKL